jgi:hypothetical protein
MSLYADGATVFIKPTAQDLTMTRLILKLFREASGLITNLKKTEFYPIRCQDLDMESLLGDGQQISEFPYSYLGLPLHYKKLPRSTIQPMVQKIVNRLPGWKRNLLAYPGRQLLVKMVISAMPTHFLTVHKMAAWAIKEVDHFRRSFLWRGQDTDKVRGGHCLVKWKCCIRPRKLGGH